MSNRELVVLGTAGQSPTVGRSQNSYALKWDDQLFVFDPGEGTQRQMMIARLHISRINRIFITHFHGDHCLGLPGLIQRWRLSGGVETLDLHYPSWGQDHVDRLLAGSLIDFDLGIVQRPVEPGETQLLGGLEITALALDHTVPTVGWRIEEPAARHLIESRLADLGIDGEAAGQLKENGSIEHGGRIVDVSEVSEVRAGPSFAFIMDTRECPNAVELARDADLVVSEATYVDEHRDLAERNGHLTAAQAAGIAARAGARRLVLSHFSERYDDYEDFKTEAAAVFTDVVVADDFDVIEVPRRLSPTKPIRRSD